MTFIAAMDHSGGSTGGVLQRYGVDYTEDNKMELVHEMRLRMVHSSNFHGENIDHAILYKDTVERGMVEELRKKGIKAILKVDSGCNSQGLLKEFDLDAMIAFAQENKCVGTKMRSIIHNIDDIDIIIEQQLQLAKRICDGGLVPIVEPEIPIDSPNKQILEDQLLKSLTYQLHRFEGNQVWLKLTLPEIPNHYATLHEVPCVTRIVGLSGGYSTEQACMRLSLNRGMQASFSRALSEGLYHDDSNEYFETAISKNISNIVEASRG